MNSAAEIWKTILTLLENEMTPTAVSTWFSEIEPVSLDENRFVLCCPHGIQTEHRQHPLPAHAGTGFFMSCSPSRSPWKSSAPKNAISSPPPRRQSRWSPAPGEGSVHL